MAIIAVAAAPPIVQGFVQQHSVMTRAERAVVLQEPMNRWHAALEQDAAALKEMRAQAERRLDQVSLQLSAVQGRILQLESLAQRLVERSGLDAQEFDFAAEPAVGGPEERSAAAPQPSSAAIVGIGAASDVLAMQVDDRWTQLRILDELLKWRDLNDAVRPEGRPVRSAYVSSAFGARIDPFTGRKAQHKGIDFAGRHGTDVVAVAAGIVTYSGLRSGYGEMIEIDHGNRLVTRYAHNSRNLVSVGDVVTRGETIAKLGSTGRATGPNLHFEVLQDGRAINPLPYIE